MKKTSSNEVWLIIDSRQYGGIETHVIQLAIGLRQYQQPVRVWLVSRYAQVSPLIEKLEKSNIQYDYLGTSSLSALLNLTHLIQQYRPLAVHAHGYRASILTKIATIRTRTYQLTTYHAGETSSGRMRLYDGVDRISAAMSDHALVVSHAIAHKIPSRTIHLKNFIDCAEMHFAHGEHIAFVGRLSKEKAPERFCRLATQFPLQSFHLYGSGPLEKAIHTMAGSNVQCHGYQADMTVVWPTISVLVICSDFEGLPMVALEAMARGIVVIAIAVGDLPCLISDGENGLLARDESMLSPQLQRWLSLSKKAQHTLRLNAANTIHQNYSQNAIIPILLALYRQTSHQYDSQIAN